MVDPVLLTAGPVSDIAFNGDQTMLYIAGANGDVIVYDTIAGQVTRTITVAGVTAFAGIDVSPDGQFLLVADDTRGSSGSASATFAVHKIDLASGTVTAFPLLFAGIEGPFHDLAILSNGTAIVTTTLRGSGATTTYTLDTATGTYQVLAGNSAQAGIVIASADRQHVLLANGFNVSGPNQLYSIAPGGSAVRLDASRGVANSGNSLAAYAPDGSLIAYVERQGGVDVFDGTLTKLRTLAGIEGRQVRGVAFDATGDYLYILSGGDTITGGGSLAPIQIDRISTVDWSVAATIAVPTLPVSLSNGYGSGENLTVGPDGAFLTYFDAVGALYRIPNPTAITPIEASLGGGTLNGTGGADVLRGGAGFEDINGGDGNDILRANGGGGLLDGGTGHDAMYGGSGDDTYVVDNLRDIAVETSDAGGIDEVRSSVSFALGPNIERIVLTGTAAINATGNAQANGLTGNNGNNTLDGGAGADIMVGGLGNDTYYIDNQGDEIIEYAGQGADTALIVASASLTQFTLSFSAEIEVLKASDRASTLSLTIVGNNDGQRIEGNNGSNNLRGEFGADTLYGYDGDDYLVGGFGADLMVAGKGSDFYQVDNNDDVVTELLGEGIDTVISYLGEYTLPDNVENLGFVGYCFLAVGNALDNIIQSTAGVVRGLDGNDTLSTLDSLTGIYFQVSDDTLEGGNGNDRLTGGVGRDTLSGGAGNDVFIDKAASLSGDTITDFAVGDRIVITDANIGAFSFTLSGTALTYSGGAMNLQTAPGLVRLVAAGNPGGGVVLSLQPVSVRNDFNGDGRSDVLWRNTNGQLSNWLGSESGALADNGGVVNQFVPLAWRIQGTADFNGDGRSDILWRNVNGQLSNWLGTANGGLQDNGNVVNQYVPLDWKIAGTGDFNGDGRADIVWRNDNGRLSSWLGTANGGLIDNFANVNAFVPTSWKIAGTGDFNGDGRDDVVWRNDNGSLSQWLGSASGALIDNGAVVNEIVPTAWKIAGTGDFNGDGFADVLWRNDNGQLSEWTGSASGRLIDNGAVVSQFVPLAWKIQGIGDFNGDGRADVAWRNDNGQLSEWLGSGNGALIDNGGVVNQIVPNAWAIHIQDYQAI